MGVRDRRKLRENHREEAVRSDRPRLQGASHGPREGPVGERLRCLNREGEREGRWFFRLPTSLPDQVLGVLARMSLFGDFHAISASLSQV